MRLLERQVTNKLKKYSRYWTNKQKHLRKQFYIAISPSSELCKVTSLQLIEKFKIYSQDFTECTDKQVQKIFIKLLLKSKPSTKFKGQPHIYYI